MPAWSYTLRRKLQEHRRAAGHVCDAWSKARWLDNSRIINRWEWRVDSDGAALALSSHAFHYQPTEASPLLHPNLISSAFTRAESFHRTQQRFSNILISTDLIERPSGELQDVGVARIFHAWAYSLFSSKVDDLLLVIVLNIQLNLLNSSLAPSHHPPPNLISRSLVHPLAMLQGHDWQKIFFPTSEVPRFILTLS